VGTLIESVDGSRFFDFGKMNVSKKEIAEADIETEIAAYRREKKK